MRIIKVANAEKFAAKVLPKQPQKSRTVVESILKDVQKNGDDAVRRYEKKFSDASISSIRVTRSEIRGAYARVSKEELSALRLAKARLEKTESAVKSLLKSRTITNDGVKITKTFVPVMSDGIRSGVN